MKNKNLATIGIFILLTANVLAFAISSEYWEENPLIISPGEIKQIQLILQNMAGTEDLEAQGSITQGQDIATIIGTNIYQIPVGQKTPVNIEITIPKNIETPTTKIILSFKTKSEGTGDFGLGASIEREIPITIKIEEKIKTNQSIYYITGILIIVILLLLIPKFKKKKKRK